MTLSGQSQAELIKAALVVAAAGVIVYFGKKFVDGFTSQLPDLANVPARVATAIGEAVGATGAAVVTATKSGIEKAADSSKMTAGTPILNNMKLLSAYSKNMADNLMGRTYNVPFDTVRGQEY